MANLLNTKITPSETYFECANASFSEDLSDQSGTCDEEDTDFMAVRHDEKHGINQSDHSI